MDRVMFNLLSKNNDGRRRLTGTFVFAIFAQTSVPLLVNMSSTPRQLKYLCFEHKMKEKTPITLWVLLFLLEPYGRFKK